MPSPRRNRAGAKRLASELAAREPFGAEPFFAAARCLGAGAFLAAVFFEGFLAAVFFEGFFAVAFFEGFLAAVFFEGEVLFAVARFFAEPAVFAGAFFFALF